eukprot:1775293-Alexandrium_andersonii.AAC.1
MRGRRGGPGDLHLSGGGTVDTSAGHLSPGSELPRGPEGHRRRRSAGQGDRSCGPGRTSRPEEYRTRS